MDIWLNGVRFNKSGYKPLRWGRLRAGPSISEERHRVSFPPSCHASTQYCVVLTMARILQTLKVFWRRYTSVFQGKHFILDMSLEGWRGIRKEKIGYQGSVWGLHQLLLSHLLAFFLPNHTCLSPELLGWQSGPQNPSQSKFKHLFSIEQIEGQK